MLLSEQRARFWDTAHPAAGPVAEQIISPLASTVVAASISRGSSFTPPIPPTPGSLTGTALAPAAAMALPLLPSPSPPTGLPQHTPTESSHLSAVAHPWTVTPCTCCNTSCKRHRTSASGSPATLNTFDGRCVLHEEPRTPFAVATSTPSASSGGGSGDNAVGEKDHAMTHLEVRPWQECVAQGTDPARAWAGGGLQGGRREQGWGSERCFRASRVQGLQGLRWQHHLRQLSRSHVRSAYIPQRT